MNKLQLYITKSYDGYKVLFNINPSEEITRHVHELRKVVGKVNYDTTEKNIFYYVTNVETGTFITIIRTIPSNNIDHLAAWIYVPNELIIDADTLERVVNTTTRKISGDKVTQDDVSTLRELFGVEYMTEAESPAMIKSNPNGKLAWRFYNGNTGITLNALMGAGLFQLPYLDYSGVIFADKEIGIEIDGADLTELPITGPAVVLPVAKTPEHFVAHIFGRPITCPVRATLDSNLTVVWKHSGFEDVITEEVITTPEFKPAVPDTSESRKEISISSFQIAGQSGNVSLEDCSITVNGINVTNKPHKFTSEQLTSAKVVINCEGYAPYSARMDLASSTRALVRLQERTKVYCFEMPVKNADLGAPVRFKIYTKKPVTGSPIDGYELLDSNILEGESRTNHLSYSSSGPSLMQKGIYAGIGLVVGLIFGWITGCGGGEKAPVIEEDSVVVEQEQVITVQSVPNAAPQQTATAQTAPKQTAPASNNAAVTAEAISYLDNNNVWTKEDLEKYPALRGLFDDLNNFRLEKISGEWNDKLSRSKRFSKLANFAKNGMNPKKKAKSKIEGNTFAKGNDNKINVTQYGFRIDP